MSIAAAINEGLHVTAIVSLSGSLYAQFFLFGSGLSETDVRRLLTSASVHAFSLLLIASSGMLRLYVFEPEMLRLLESSVFMLKLQIFIVFVLCSLYPAFTFYRWRKELKQGQPSMISYRQHTAVLWCIRFELAALMLIPMLAAFARVGFGISS
ncbi:DUF2214 family protein [Alginatibacterium sediminis]|uniref:DUF2214 family protein n=1 Tax=Alginatibacterium sediminis TaxID=2164068 RepID=A0A420ENL0_9ALTE|nr:DUF2214 family protein [Alginatibacterium sediminis]RKF22184.1 DUF2214 family protein [Alginatibacterium sediminis]